MGSLIWSDSLDDIHTCEVYEKTGSYGEMNVYRQGTMIYSGQIVLTYNDLYGPDGIDILEWKNEALRIIQR